MDLLKESDLFEQWWDDEGQYHRAGGDDYCKTFAWEAWIFSKAQSEKALLEQFEINNKLVEQIEKLKAKAIPDGFVWVKIYDLELLRDSALEIKYASLNSDSDRIYSDIEDIQLSVERLIEAQEQSNDS